MNEALKASELRSRCSLSRRSVARMASETTQATSNMVRALYRLGGASPAGTAPCVSKLMTAWVPARLPELSKTSTRSPGRSKAVILQNDATSSRPAFVRESDPITMPSSRRTPTQYVTLSRSPPGTRRPAARSSGDLVGPDAESQQRIGPEGRADSDVRGVTAARDQDAPDARDVVAGIEGVPGAAQIGFEPAGEVHGRGVLGAANITQVAGAI